MTLLDTFFNGQVMVSAFPALMRGLFNTLLLGLLAIGIGIPVGLVISLVRLYAPKPLRWLAIGYIDIFRAMPVLVVLILIYYALPFVGIRLSSWVSATLAFTFIMSAYSAEVFRSGIESIPNGQFEAAHALGLTFLQTLYKVILPQAVRVVIPPATSNCVSMFKDTSLASAVALRAGVLCQPFAADRRRARLSCLPVADGAPRRLPGEAQQGRRALAQSYKRPEDFT